MSQLQPPFIADLLSYLLLAALFGLLIYSFILRRNLMARFDNQKKIKNLQRNPVPTHINQQKKYYPIPEKVYYIEPSEIYGKQVQFPSILNPPEISLSIIIPVYNMQNEVISIYDKIQSHFFNKSQNSNNTFTYEVIVVDINSSDNTYQVTYDYAIQNPEFRLLHLTDEHTFSDSITQAGIRSRGKQIFIYFAQEHLPLSLFDEFAEKLNKTIEQNHNEKAVLLPCFEKVTCELTNSDRQLHKLASNKKDDEIECIHHSNHDYYQTLFSSFLEYLHKSLLLRSIDMNPKVEHHYLSMIFTREAAKIFFGNIKYQGNAFDQELFVIADIANIVIKCAMLPYGIQNDIEIYQSSWMRLETLFALIECLLLYKTRTWTVRDYKYRS